MLLGNSVPFSTPAALKRTIARLERCLSTAPLGSADRRNQSPRRRNVRVRSTNAVIRERSSLQHPRMCSNSRTPFGQRQSWKRSGSCRKTQFTGVDTALMLCNSFQAATRRAPCVGCKGCGSAAVFACRGTDGRGCWPAVGGVHVLPCAGSDVSSAVATAQTNGLLAFRAATRRPLALCAGCKGCESAVTGAHLGWSRTSAVPRPRFHPRRCACRPLALGHVLASFCVRYIPCALLPLEARERIPLTVHVVVRMMPLVPQKLVRLGPRGMYVPPTRRGRWKSFRALHPTSDGTESDSALSLLHFSPVSDTRHPWTRARTSSDVMRAARKTYPMSVTRRVT